MQIADALSGGDVEQSRRGSGRPRGQARAIGAEGEMGDLAPEGDRARRIRRPGQVPEDDLKGGLGRARPPATGRRG